MFAYRNLRMCSKDCMCLYVCPTGATDTETGQIDFKKCIGCGACVKSCPGKAISMIPENYPKQQPHDENVVKAVRQFSASKAEQEAIAKQVAADADPVLEQIMNALTRSNRLMGEDLVRETGYMLPQSGEVRRLLETMLTQIHDIGFPKDAAYELLKTLNFNE